MPATDIIRKATVHPETKGAEFVMSDGSVDHYGDVVEPGGWDLRFCQPDAIALWNHDPNEPIGRWENVRVEKGKLRGHLKFADEGTSPTVDKLRKLNAQGVVKAASVGFRRLESEPLDPKNPGRGVRYKRHYLLECSLVSMPANSNAQQIARSLNLSADEMRLVFGPTADTAPALLTRGLSGPTAVTPPAQRTGRPMEPIAKRIEGAQTKLAELRDQLTTHLERAGDEPDETAQLVTEELNHKLASAQRNLTNLEDAERQLGNRAVQVAHERKAETHSGEILPPLRRPFAAPAEKEPTPGERVMRVIIGNLVSYARRMGGDYSSTPLSVMAERFGADGKIDERTKAVSDILTRSEAFATQPEMVLRAATAPATTFTSGWASQLVQTANQGILDILPAASIFPGVSARAMRLSFGRAGIISIPRRSATPTISGAFVLEGNPIPVKQGAYTSVTFSPKKMGVISLFTREISEHSTPDIEMLIRDHMETDTAVTLDGTLIDATAADTARPAGIRNGVAATTATAGGGFTALVGDVKALVGAVLTITNGNLRRPVWLMNPAQALSAQMTVGGTGGDFPFAAEVSQGTLNGYPLIVSGNVPAGVVILLDAADFAVIEAGAPRFSVSDQATVHMEDTTPLQLATGAQGSGVLATPARSMFQTDSIALRMTFDVNWGHLRATPALAWTQAVTW